jgi:iron(III) transport system ATP-binding protein
VLLDEPFSGLDAALRAETRAAVTNALAREGTTAVLVTHDQAEALSMGREVAVLRAGRLVQTAAPSALYRAPVDLELARFVGDAVVVPGVVGSGLVDCVLGRLSIRGSSPEGAVQVMIRPEQIRLEPATPTPRSSSAPGVEAEVVGHSYYGPETTVRLELRDGSRTPVIAKTFDQEIPAAGELVRAVIHGPVPVYPTENRADRLPETSHSEGRSPEQAARPAQQAGLL